MNGNAHYDLHDDPNQPDGALTAESQVDVANVVVERLRGRAMYAPIEKAWYLYDGRRWVEDDKGAVFWVVAPVIQSILETAEKRREHRRVNRLSWMLGVGGIRSVLQLAGSDPRLKLPTEVWNPDPYLFNVTNGTLDLRTGVLREHRHDDHITKVAACAFELEAHAEHFLAMLDRILPGGRDGVSARYLQQALGVSLLGVRTAEIVHVLEGKSLAAVAFIVRAIEAVWGEYAYIEDPGRVERRLRPGRCPSTLAFAPFFGARCIILPLSGTERDAEAIFGRIADRCAQHGEIHLRDKRGRHVSLGPHFTVWLPTPNVPASIRASGRMNRRLGILRVIDEDEAQQPAGRRRPEWYDLGGDAPYIRAAVDDDTAAHLAAEASGILNFALAGLAEYMASHSLPDLSSVTLQSDHAGAGSPQARTEAMDRTVNQFMAEQCVTAEGEHVSKRAFRESLGLWLRSRRIAVPSAKAITSTMRRRGIAEGRSSGMRFWRDIVVKDVTARSDGNRSM